MGLNINFWALFFRHLALWDLDSQGCESLPCIFANTKMVVGSLRDFKSLGATVAQSKSIYRDAVGKKPHNILALNHEPIETTAHQVLLYAINLLKSKGYQLVTLAECLNLPAYRWEGTPGAPDVNPFFSSITSLLVGRM